MIAERLWWINMTITATNGIKTQQYIKPQSPKGKLVSSSILPSWKDTKYNIKALKHGLTGKANDHELGKEGKSHKGETFLFFI